MGEGLNLEIHQLASKVLIIEPGKQSLVKTVDEVVICDKYPTRIREYAGVLRDTLGVQIMNQSLKQILNYGFTQSSAKIVGLEKAFVAQAMYFGIQEHLALDIGYLGSRDVGPIEANDQMHSLFEIAHNLDSEPYRALGRLILSVSMKERFPKLSEQIEQEAHIQGLFICLSNVKRGLHSAVSMYESARDSGNWKDSQWIYEGLERALTFADTADRIAGRPPVLREEILHRPEHFLKAELAQHGREY